MDQTVRWLTIWCAFSASALGQTVLKLSLKQALELAASSTSNASVGVAAASLQIAEARRAQARSLLYPTLESTIGESNLTRNLAAEGFNFPTGVPNFTIPHGVGPFNNFDARVLMSQTVLDLSASRRYRGLLAGIEAARADIAVQREQSAVQVAHDYLAALRGDSTVTAAQAGVSLAETLLTIARDREEAGKAAAVEVTRAKLRLATDRRKLAAAENGRLQARLQLLSDLGVDFDTPLELTDRLDYAPGTAPDTAGTIAAALGSRAEIQAIRKREEEARSNDSAIQRERLPSVTAYGDVGPLNSVVTHTVGISVRIPLFDGGRRAARSEESRALVQQSAMQQRDLRRQIELQVRRSSAGLTTAAASIAACDEALALAEDELAQARRRFEGGISSNIEVVEAQALLAQARDDRIAAVFSWNQARVDLAQAAGTVGTLSMPAN
jgi:outer membrane protein TolC